MSRIEFKVTGMVCAGCSQTVQRIVTGLGGVIGADVDHETGAASADVTGGVEPDAIHAAIRDAGFGVSACGNDACGCANCDCDPCLCT